MQRTHPRIAPPGRIRHPLPVEEPHRLGLEPEPGRLLRHRRARTGQVGVGVQQPLQVGDGQRCRIPQPQASQRRQRPAGAVAHHRHRPRERTEFGRTGADPPQRGHRVVDRGGPRMFRRQPVVEGEHRRTRRIGQPPGEPVERDHVADRPAPAVQVHHQRPGVRRRAVEAGGHAARRHVPDLGQLRPRTPLPDPLGHPGPHGAHVQLAQSGRPGHELRHRLVRELRFVSHNRTPAAVARS
jgi:hypothetical protein